MSRDHYFQLSAIGTDEIITKMIILHFHLQPQFIYELFHINVTSFHSSREDMNSIKWPRSQCVA